MNTTSTTLDRDESYSASQNGYGHNGYGHNGYGQNGSGRGRHAHPASENCTGRGQHARPSRVRSYVIGTGVAVVGGAAIVAGLLATSSNGTAGTPTRPGPAATSHTGGSGTHTANPAVPSHPNANPAVPSHPGAQTANPAVPATPGSAS